MNEFMQSSDPSIYAVGDAVEYAHGILGCPIPVALAGPANRAGRLAGEHAATDRAQPMSPVMGTAVVRVFEKTVAMTGLSAKRAQEAGLANSSVIIEANHRTAISRAAKLSPSVFLSRMEIGVQSGPAWGDRLAWKMDPP